MNLDIITGRLGERYRKAKESERELKESRAEFFKACDEIVAEQTLAQMVVHISAGAGDDLDTYVSIYYPGYKFIEELDTKNIWIEENPSYKPYAHVDSESGLVYKREITQAGPSLDDEKLRTKDPDLWKRITKPTRILKDLETVSDEDLNAMQEYFVPGKMVAKLAAPRKPKPDELDV